MRLSAKLRWFWKGRPAKEFESWFAASGKGWHAARPAKTRLDEYLVDDTQRELGIKKRSGRSLARCTAGAEL
jgi:hypothetical protein